MVDQASEVGLRRVDRRPLDASNPSSTSAIHDYGPKVQMHTRSSSLDHRHAASHHQVVHACNELIIPSRPCRKSHASRPFTHRASQVPPSRDSPDLAPTLPGEPDRRLPARNKRVHRVIPSIRQSNRTWQPRILKRVLFFKWNSVYRNSGRLSLWNPTRNMGVPRCTASIESPKRQRRDAMLSQA